MSNVAWFVKYLTLPMAPFLIGGLIRTIYAGRLSLESVSPAELSFSVAMLSLVISSKASQLSDRNLRDALTSLFQLGVMVFLALFAWSVFIETDIASSLTATWQKAQQSAKAGMPFDVGDLPPHLNDYHSILQRLRWTALVVSGLVVPLTVYATNKYNLQEL